MFAGSGTGGIPGSGTDRSATGPATGQVTAVLDAERTGDSRTVLGCGVRVGADAGVCEAGRKITTPTATTAIDTPQNHTRRLARWPAGQPTLLMPILSLHRPRSAPRSADGYTGARAVNHGPLGSKLSCMNRRTADVS